MLVMSFETPSQIGFTIYSKSNCSFCTKVKQLLTDNQIFFLEIQSDEYLLEDKEGFLLFIQDLIKKEYRTFPMVFNNGQFIGGFTDTELFVNKQLCFNNI
jgi:glutaredoxin